MKIFKKIAVRAIPTALLAFLIFAAIAYQRGLYDFTFIERTTGPEQNPDTLPDNSTDMPIVDDMTASDTTDTGTPVDSSDETTIIDGTVTDAPEEDEVSKFLSLMSTTQDALKKGWTITDENYSSGMRLTLCDPDVAIRKDYSLRSRQETVYERVHDDEYGTYKTVEKTVTAQRPLVETYMDYIIVDTGSKAYLLDSSGKLVMSNFDVETYKPAYTRGSDDSPQFKAEVRSRYNPSITYTQYYKISPEGKLILSDYDDAADGRGLYFNYPSSFGKSDNGINRYYDPSSMMYGYGSSPTSMRTHFKFTKAYNYSEGLAAVINEEGHMSFIQNWFYDQIASNPAPYINQKWHWRVYSFMYAPDTNGTESLGFYYFDHGLVRVRVREYDAFHYEKGEMRVTTDFEKVIRTDGTEYSIPGGFEVKAYSDGVFLLEKDGLYGFMDYTGRWIAQPEYDTAEPFVEGLAVLGKNGNVGLIDTEGNIVIPLIFDKVQSCSGGTISAWDKDNGWAIFNKLK